MAFNLTSSSVYENSIDRERAIAALKKAKELEEKRCKEGWRFVKINNRLSSFVPCDKKGKPTQHAEKMLEIQRNSDIF